MVAMLSSLDAAPDLEAMRAHLLDSTAERLRARARASLGAAQRARDGHEGPAVLRLRMLGSPMRSSSAPSTPKRAPRRRSR
ncbi:MAG: hypothetical protein HZY79_03320 [Rhodoblastus sp.]|nr:MAG: hypothetical protein HZY79_03320 [Rhodoblastus sp.]